MNPIVNPIYFYLANVCDTIQILAGIVMAVTAITMTDLFIALEKHEYERAKTYARMILNRSEWIERRLVALTVLNLAARHDDATTDKTLDIAYDNDTRAKKYRF